MRRRLRDGRDGRALVEELERLGEALPAGADKSSWFLELGVACEMLVPERQRALLLYRRAAEMDPDNAEALDRGRMVSRELGRLDALIHFTEIDLSRERDDGRREHLSALIGEALLDLGDRQRAAGFLVGAAGQYPASLAIQDALGTVGYDDDWRAEVERLIAIGDDTDDAPAGARVYLRAARILGMEASGDERHERLLRRVLDCDPYDESAHMLLDALYARGERWDELALLQEQLVQAFPGADEQAALCQRFSFSSIARGQHERAEAWCWRAIGLGRLVYPIAGLTLLRGIYGARRDWDRLLAAVDALLVTPLDEDADVHTALLGGTIAWKARGDVARAAGYFGRVRRVAVDSLLVLDFDEARADERHPEVIGDEQRALIETARRLSQKQSVEPVDRAIDAWRRAIAVDPMTRAPRRALARVLYRAERWRTLADALKDEEAHACRDDEERVTLLMQLAALYRDRLRQDLLAAATLARVVELVPTHEAALEQLVQLYAQLRRWPEMAAALARKLVIVEGPQEKLALQLQLAELWQNELGNEAESVKALEAALALDPGRTDVAERLERAYGKRREWDKLYALKLPQAQALSEPDARLAAMRELAQLASEKIKRHEPAVTAWSEVLALAPGDEAALTNLERLYAAEQAHSRLAEVYRRRAEWSDPAIQLTYLQKLAALYMAELGDPERAIVAWQRVLALAPGHGRALEMLRRLYVDQRHWDALEALFLAERSPTPSALGLAECARLFERQAPEEPLAVEVELWLRAARLWQGPLGRRAEAQRAFEKVLALDGDGQAGADALAALMVMYEDAGDLRKLAHALALQLQHDREISTRKARALRLASLHGRELYDVAGAFRWQLEAFTLDPADVEVRAELERLAGRAAAWAPLIGRYLEVVAARPDVDRVALLTTVAREREAALGDVDGALTVWQELGALESPPREALEALARLYEARAAWRELHDVYGRKLQLAEDATARRPIVLAMAALAERQGDDARAIADYRRLVDELGSDDASLAALERLYERAGALAEVEAVLRERLALPKAAGADEDDAGERRTGLTYRLAEVRRRQGGLGAAIALYGLVLEAEPNHTGARAALETIIDGEQFRLEAALLLEPILRATGAAARLCHVLRIRVAAAEAPADAVALMHEIAWLEERELGRRDAAFATLAEALHADPLHPPTYDALERLTAGHGDWERLATLYKEIAGRPLAIAGHVEVRCRLAAVYRDRLNAPDRAAATLARVLDLMPEHTAAALQLAALHERDPEGGARAVAVYAALWARKPTTAQAALERLFAAGVARAEAGAALMARYRQESRMVDLVRVWTATLIDAPDGKPLDELVATAHAAGQTEALRRALAAAVTRATGAATRAELRLTAAELAAKAGERGMAVMLLRQHLDEEPSHAAVLAALDSIFATERRQTERIETLGLRAALAGPGERVPLWLERAELQEGLRDVEGARASLRAALAAGEDPRALRALARVAEDEEALAALERLCAIVPDDEEALAGLATLYERQGRWRELMRVLERQAALAPASPGPLRALARRLRAAQRWDELADVLARLVRLDDGDEVRGDLIEVNARRAELTEDRDEQRARWAEVAEEALRLGRWSRAVEGYRRVGELLPPGDERADQLYRAGVICRDELGDYDEALACFAAAVASYAGGGEPPATLAEALARLQAARRGGGGRGAGGQERASGAEVAYHPRTGR